jgi:hypothetical protein
MRFSKAWILIVVLAVCALSLITSEGANAACATVICPCHVILDCDLFPWSPNCWSVGSVGTGCSGDNWPCEYDEDGNQCGYAFGWALGECVIPCGPCGGVYCYPE